MATVKINELSGTNSISGDRITINSNFITLQNWINGYITTFGVDSTNGILNLLSASTGKVSAKIGSFNNLSLPGSGTAKISMNSSGDSSFASVSTTTLTVSGSSTINGNITISSAATLTAGGTASFNGPVNLNGAVYLGTAGHVISQNSVYLTGATSGTAFPANTLGGGGYRTANMNSPYGITGLEDVIYADCAGPTGFYMRVVTGNSPFGGTLPNIPSGTRITIVNTSSATGYIWTGTTGASTYYTGFNNNSSYGGYASTGIVIPQNKSYRASLTLQWESRVGQGQADQNGSWVVLSSSNVTV
jgi:hypothetical protein